MTGTRKRQKTVETASTEYRPHVVPRRRRRGMGAWNAENVEMTTQDFEEYMKRRQEDGVQPINVVMEIMMNMNVSMDDLQNVFSINLLDSFTDLN
jgi:hypothetical protein